jgi:exopolyphosphatase/guanosine-5'-triphosphate,3'-diphosphate pyrophosphatase
MFLSHAQHHKHSYYVIRGTDRLAGFNDDEVERIALVARYHRKSEPKSRHPEWAALDADTQREVAVLAGLLRVATGLDRNHAARVQSVAVKDKGDRLIVKVTPVPGEDIALELYAAAARPSLLDSVLGVTTEVREA